MIARVWHGWASGENADRYEAHLRAEILPGIHRIEGYAGAYLGSLAGAALHSA
ncbi:MAG: hypothetical protein ACRDNE_14400 [Gaiellaceae bacterium]